MTEIWLRAALWLALAATRTLLTGALAGPAAKASARDAVRRDLAWLRAHRVETTGARD
jgi:hypothetical protein